MEKKSKNEKQSIEQAMRYGHNTEAYLRKTALSFLTHRVFSQWQLQYFEIVAARVAVLKDIVYVGKTLLKVLSYSRGRRDE